MPPKSCKIQLAAVLSDDELTDNKLSNDFEENNIWYDHDLKETVNKISQFAFDIMYQNAKNPVIFNHKCSLTYHGNSDRTKRQKKAAAKAVCKGFTSITEYFTNNSLLDNPINTIIDDLKNLDKVIEKEGFNLALEELNTLIKDNLLVS
ncbi:hypothetical protein RclHR1_21240001 [Rhizophagus clarus]|uniref:Uncharacterized protein n=1 Tax=Rhizophagus clarus TaxID=94130 RepID=A0A2Z6RLH8_9GLOM|nr:hypothetical protein RclHR1_21240001 [Rhizophagus clarus]